MSDLPPLEDLPPKGGSYKGGKELDTAVSVARAVHEAGGRALIVGGWVRDRLMGLPSKDIDVEVFGIDGDRLKEILQKFGSVNTVGESFTVYKVADLDVSLPRRESKTGRGHRGFTVSGDPALPLREAARRRDFTVNAIAWDPLTGEHEDPFDGRGDIERRLLRAVDPLTFGDDSLRVLRAIQFAARFEFEIDAGTKALCRTIPLDDLPAERVWGEIEKLLLRARKPSLGFALALELGVIARVFPELEALVGCQQEPEWHPEGDVWVHTLLVIDEARTRIDDLGYPQQVAVMLGAVCHDLGKPPTTAFIDGRIRSIDHEDQGVPPARAFLDRLNVHSMLGYDVRHQVLGMVANHLKPGMFAKAQPPVGDGAYRRLAKVVSDRPDEHRNLLRSWQAVDASSRLVDHLERMHPDIPFGVPLRFLRAADERVQFGEELLDHAEFERETKANRRSWREEQFLELTPDALGRQIVERDGPADCARLVVDG